MTHGAMFVALKTDGDLRLRAHRLALRLGLGAVPVAQSAVLALLGGAAAVGTSAVGGGEAVSVTTVTVASSQTPSARPTQSNPGPRLALEAGTLRVTVDPAGIATVSPGGRARARPSRPRPAPSPAPASAACAA